MASTRLLAIAAVAVLIGALGAWWFTQGNKPVRIQVTTTTSLYATGLLDKLADAFHQKHPNVRIEFIAVGSGEALRRAAAGDACMVFVHAPSLEKKYIASGVLEKHRFIAYNYFAVVGPSSDPAGVKTAKSAVDAFRRIYRAGEEEETRFISRGDNSGTHVREQMIWRLAGLDPHGRPWYVESGQGMAETLLMAEEMKAYTLSDTGTYLRLSREGRLPDLSLLYTNSSELINVYSVYIVSSCGGDARHYAELFEEFVAGPEGQKIITSYGVKEYGAHLFYPAAGHEQLLEKAWEQLSKG